MVTGSTLLEAPYAFARRIATLDQLSAGRMGWNIVTTGTADTATRAFGVPMVAHDERYVMADEFMQVVYALWEGGWEPDALVRDKSGIYADPAKIHLLHHEGKRFRLDGYSNTSYSPQGTPVLFQAGTSAAGRAFGGRHAECIFLGGGSVAQLAGHVGAIRNEVVDAGRSASSVALMSAFSCVIGGTHSEAEKKWQSILDSRNPELAIASFASFTGIDLSAFDRETPMSSLHTELGQSQIARFGDQTVGEVLQTWHTHGGGATPIVGDAEEIADAMIGLAEGADLDGFLLTPQVQPGSTIDFVEQVLPILRRRGVVATDYEAQTLRERLLGTDDPYLPADHPGASYRAGLRTA